MRRRVKMEEFEEIVKVYKTSDGQKFYIKSEAIEH